MRLNQHTVKDFMLTYWIVGVITNQDEILSILKCFEDIENHEDYYPLIQKRWRWSYQDGVDWSSSTVEITKDDRLRVREHLTRKYGIRFWDNGYHDLDYFKTLKQKDK